MRKFNRFIARKRKKESIWAIITFYVLITYSINMFTVIVNQFLEMQLLTHLFSENYFSVTVT